ncbi:histamine H2 receptor-like [Anneissia japonica]|uniref:histamine H2 receptor-like n=1 Tax=Anneissia japonica TaxID=1529436 RepID=UPI001425B72C|nr:histamine H2 receptor-like [Anneissia japonica]
MTPVTKNYTITVFGDCHLFNRPNSTSIAFSFEVEFNCTVLYLFTCIQIVLFIIGCTGNVIVLFLIRRCRQLRGAPVLLLVNLAVTDLFVCLTYFPLFIYATLQPIAFPTSPFLLSTKAYLVMLFLEFQSQLCSALTIASINLERCYVLIYPLRVHTVITFKRKLLVTGSIWVISILCSIHVLFMIQWIMFLNDEFDLWQPLTQFIIPAIIVVVSCVITSVTLVKRIQSNRLQESSQSNMSTKNPKKALKTVTIVAVVFLFMTSPSALSRFWMTADFSKKFRYFWPSIESELVWYITNLLRVSNSCINPFIYALMSSNFRSAIKSTFCCKTALTNRQNSALNPRSRTLQNRV